MAKLKIGFIGCGGIANQKHFPGMSQQTEYVDMCAFCDLIPERAEKAAKEYGTPGAKVYTCLLYTSFLLPKRRQPVS